MPATTPATNEDVRELEARIDARFQVVSSRFVRCDNRFATIDNRLSDAEQRQVELEKHVSTRLGILDAALEAADATLDRLHQQIYTAEALAHQGSRHGDQLARRIIVAILGSTTLIAALWAVTTFLLLTDG